MQAFSVTPCSVELVPPDNSRFLLAHGVCRPYANGHPSVRQQLCGNTQTALGMSCKLKPEVLVMAVLRTGKRRHISSFAVENH